MATKVTGNLSEEKLAAIAALFAYNGWDWDPEEERRMSDAAPVSLGPVIEGTVGKPECPDFFCRPAYWTKLISSYGGLISTMHRPEKITRTGKSYIENFGPCLVIAGCGMTLSI